MTAILVLAALIAANVAYSIVDSRNAEAARQLDAYYRVEYKKSYGVSSASKALNNLY